MDINLTPYEKESIILTSAGDDEYSVETFNPGLKRRLAKLSKEFPAHCILKWEQPEGSVRYFVKKECLAIHLSPPYSEERRRKAREQAKKNGLIGGNPADKPDAA